MWRTRFQKQMNIVAGLQGGDKGVLALFSLRGICPPHDCNRDIVPLNARFFLGGLNSSYQYGEFHSKGNTFYGTETILLKASQLYNKSSDSF